jgi:hypothetical protein
MKIIEVKGDLFKEPFEKDSDIYVHCISQDFAMGAGIAKTFSQKFPQFIENRKEMMREYNHKNPYKRIYVAICNGTKIVNLVTKAKYWMKPTMTSLELSLWNLRKFIEDNPDIKRILMPRIGSGLDKLKWGEVKSAILENLEDLDIEVKVFYLK